MYMINARINSTFYLCILYRDSVFNNYFLRMPNIKKIKDSSALPWKIIASLSHILYISHSLYTHLYIFFIAILHIHTVYIGTTFLIILRVKVRNC